MVCGLWNGMWAFVLYEGCCLVCGLLYIWLQYMLTIELYVGCGMVCGLF